MTILSITYCHYTCSYDNIFLLTVDDEIVHAAQAFVTGGRGNVDYVKELKPQIQKQGNNSGLAYHVTSASCIATPSL